MEIVKECVFYPEGHLIDAPGNRKAINSLSALSEACLKGTIIEARVSMCDFSHNLIVDLPCARGIIPREEGAVGISEGFIRDIALISRVGKPVCFVVEEILPGKGDKPLAMLSRKKAQEKCGICYLDNLIPGDIIDAKVTHLEPFGAFCDIGCGIISLLPVDCISVSRIFHPSDRFFPGDDIRVIVKGRDERGRINLTHKELLGTWKENADLFSQGETVPGIIRTVESYGSFVELTPNLAGLAEPKEGIYPGQCASVYIKSIIPDKMKVKLIIIDACDEEYSTTEQNYFYFDNHISKWDYSPESCLKHSGTVFE